MLTSSLQQKLAFASLRGMNVSLARELLRLCGSEADFFAATETQLRYLTGSRARIYSDAARKEALEFASREMVFLEANSVRALYFTDSDYPQRLLECEDAPALLYVMGRCDLNASRTVGIVGTRHATQYGTDFTRHLVEDLAAELDNPVIISGLAYGIDIAAHRAALQAGLPTVAVMATAMNTIYPAEHRSTAIDMLRHGGMLVSEYSSREPIHKGNFVARNRIVAGMCDCLVVSESASKGGALITADLAMGYNRDVFALPGRIGDKYSAGCNCIIASQRAQLITCAQDLCHAMGWPMRSDSGTARQPSLPLAMNPEEELIVKYLEQNEDAPLNALTLATGFPVGKLMSLLLDMEFRGLILSLPGARYRAVAAT